MCRNIKTLFNFAPPVTDDEVRAASLQFVRKITGFNKPSKANEDAFLGAIEEIAGISTRLLRSLETTAPPKNREEEAAKARPVRLSASEHESYGLVLCQIQSCAQSKIRIAGQAYGNLPPFREKREEGGAPARSVCADLGYLGMH